MLPTGAGKSMCYQIPGLYLDGMTLVISPLIALMKDQITGLKEKGIKAAGLYSGQSRREQDIILDNAVYGDQKFLFVSPERLKTRIFKERFIKMHVSLVAVDEAHCISEWGHDFRPEYRMISELRELKNGVPILALTATATKTVVADLVENLKFENHNQFISSPTRTNLSYNTLYTEAKKETLSSLVTSREGGKIIYVNTRKNTKELARHLTAKGINCKAYHGGMQRKERDACMVAWNNNSIRVIIATKAFGMGIDKADVRIVIHYQPPQSLEAYVQEAGRAGRDGEYAEAIIMYNKGDFNKLEKLIDESFPSLDYLKQTYQQLCQYLKVASGPCETEFYPFFLDEFAKKYSHGKLKLFNALKLLHRFECIYLSDAILHPSKLRLKESNTKHILSNPKLSTKMAEFVKLLLRNYEGLFLDYTVIDEKTVSTKFQEPISKVKAALSWLEKNGVGEYKPAFEGHTISFMEYRYKSDEIPIDLGSYNFNKKRMVDSIDSLKAYIKEENCRQRYISDYFGFQDGNCEICDNCEGFNSQSHQREIQNKVIEFLSNSQPTINQLYSNFKIGQRKSIQSILSEMESENEISIVNSKILLDL